MRRFLIFVVLFAAGLSTLVYLERRSTSTEPAKTTQPQGPQPGRGPGLEPDPEPGLEPEPRAEPEQPVQDGATFETDDGIHMRPLGATEFEWREPIGNRQVLLRRIEVTDTLPIVVDDKPFLRCVDAHAWLYDRQTGDLRLELETKSATATRIAGSRPIDENEPIVFEEVKLTVPSELAFAPLEASVPDLSGTLAGETFGSDSPVTIEGRGLSGRGVGLDLGLASLRLRSEVKLTFTLPDGASGELDCDGPLAFEKRPELGPDAVAVIAKGAVEGAARDPQDDGAGLARFELQGQRSPITLEGETLELVGTLEGNDFVPAQLFATIRANILLDGNRFSGDRARIEFSADGVQESASLVGRPVLTLSIDALRAGNLPIELPEALRNALGVRVRGSGPLELEFEPGAEESFRFAGPLVIELDGVDAELRASEAFVGRRAADETFQELRALGQVTGTYGGYRLEAVEVELLAPDSAQPRIHLEIVGPSLVTGELDDGRKFETRSAGLSLIEADGRTTWLRSSERASFVVDLPEGAGEGRPGAQPGTRTGARADLLTDFNLDAQTFEASGDVAVTDFPVGIDESTGKWVLVDGSAERVERSGPKQIRMWGAERQAVVVSAASGRLEADAIDVSANELIALGNSRIDVTLDADAENLIPERHFELAGRSLLFESFVLGARRVVRISAEGEARLSRTTEDLADTPELEDSEIGISADWISAEGSSRSEDYQPSLEYADLGPDILTARGQVELHGRGGFDYDVTASGSQLLLNAPGTGLLRGTPEEPVHAIGTFTSENLSLDLIADQVDFGVESLSALNPDVRLEGFVVPMGPLTEDSGLVTLLAQAQHMICDRRSVMFSENVHIERADPSKERWSLDAGFASMKSQSSFAEGVAPDQLSELVAGGGFTAQFGNDLEASGDKLMADQTNELVRLSGSPAIVKTLAFQGESEWIEWDTVTGLLYAAAGRLVSIDPDDSEPWSIEFTSMAPLSLGDVSVQIVRQPTISEQDSTVRASWAVFWVDSEEWTRLSEGFISGEELDTDDSGDVPISDQDGQVRMPSLIMPLQQTPLARWLREAYIEGDVECYSGGRRVGRADAMYLDLADGHGWLQNVEIRSPLSLGDRPAELKLSVDWLRHSADGSMRADDATITTCMFEKPHYRIRSGDLRLTPRSPKRGNETFWELEFKKNTISFGQGFALPLPDSFPIPLNKSGMLHVEEAPSSVQNLGEAGEAVGGSTRRFGTFIRARFIQDIPNVGQWLHKLVGGDPDKMEGGIKYDVGILGKRGLLLGVNPHIEQAGLYFLDIGLNTVYDTGKDRGLLRDDDRSDLRRWFTMRGRYEFDETTWIDVVGTTQSDFAVQSEFWESEFLAFEQRETFAHFRRAKGADYTHATLRLRWDDYRSETEELPEVGYYKGATQIADIGELPLLYSNDTNVGYYRRRQGNPSEDLFATGFDDGRGNEDVLRADSLHRLSLPANLGDTGLRATPFVEGRGTVWDESEDGENSPVRAGLSAGLEVSTFLWRQFGKFRHNLVPSITFRTDVAVEGDNDASVDLDGTEESLKGQFVDLDLRQRLVASDRTHADLVLRTTWGDEVHDGDPGWLPLFVNSDVFSEVAGIPFAIHHDARYELDDSETEYSRTRFGFEPVKQLALEIGYDSGRSPDGNSLYNAYTLGALFRPNSKWEFEGQYVFRTDSSERLSTSVIVRRFGHDMVFEVETQAREGEGSGVAFGLRPILVWKNRGLGFLDQHRDGRW